MDNVTERLSTKPKDHSLSAVYQYLFTLLLYSLHTLWVYNGPKMLVEPEDPLEHIHLKRNWESDINLLKPSGNFT
jgi:hypothetical protein